MKITTFVLLALLFSTGVQAQFNQYFENSSLRMDYTHSGTATTEHFALESLLKEPYWGGSHFNLVDTFQYGNYMLSVFSTDGHLLYSRGYSSLFAEWQTTAEAALINRNFFESVIMPFPKKPVKVLLSSRNRSGVFEEKFSIEVDPDDYFIRPSKKLPYEIKNLMISDSTQRAVDIVLLPDGYSASEMEKFEKDCQMFINSLFAFEPYKTLKNKFNIRAVAAISDESGIAIPAKNFWPQTILSSSFYTFDSERYCMSTDHKSIRDLAGQVPYDQIYILANSEKYGGGGIYNFYCLSTTGSSSSAKIIVHEFGHGFVGLGDEYFDSSTAYHDFYNLNIEPWEPNLTTMVTFASKWQHLIKPGTPVPTPDLPDFDRVTGVFEGGGYVSKGMYRPARDCLMHTFRGNEFCEVCIEATVKMIRFYSDSP